MKTRRIALFACLLAGLCSILFLAVAGPVQAQDYVDINDSGIANQQSGWLQFNNTATNNTNNYITPFVQTFSSSGPMNGVTVTLTGNAGLDVRNRGLSSSAVTGSTYDNMLDDFVRANTSSGTISMVMSGLAPGNYALQTYAWDSNYSSMAAETVTIDGTVAGTVAQGYGSNATAFSLGGATGSSPWMNFTVGSAGTATILFSNNGTTAESVLNGFGLKTTAAAVTWNGGSLSSDNWSDGVNWGGTAPLAGDALVFAGANRLTPNNDFAANTAFAGIAFNNTAGAFTLSGSNVNLAGDIVNSSASLQTVNLNLALQQAVNFNAAGGNLAIGGNISGGFGVTKQGSGTLTLSGSNGFSGGLSLAGGVLVLGSSNALGTGTLTISGGTLGSGAANLVNAGNNSQIWNGNVYFQGSNNLDLGSGVVTVTTNPTVTVSTGTLAVGGISGSGYTLTKAGTGTLVLNGATTLANLRVGYQASSGTVVVGSGASLSVGSGSASNLYVAFQDNNGYICNGTLDASAAANFNANVAGVYIGEAGSMAGNSYGILKLGTSSTITASSVFDVGYSRWDVGTYGTLTIAPAGAATVHTPTMRIGYATANGTSAAVGTVTLGSGATLTLDGNVAGNASGRTALDIGYNYQQYGRGPNGGTMDLSAGVANLTLSSLAVGYQLGNTSAPGQLLIGTSPANHLDISGTGSVVQVGYLDLLGGGNNGGTSSGTLTIGNLDATSAITSTDSSTAILVGYRGTGATGSDLGVLNLNGGSLTITTSGAAISGGGTGTSHLSLGGASSGVTLIAGSSSSNWIQNLTTATINTGGVTFNTNGNSITIPQAFAGGGGMTKAGAGTLILSGSSTYNGGTTVNAGTLIVTGSNTFGASGPLSVAGNASFLYRPTVPATVNLGSSAISLANNSTVGVAVGGSLSQSAITTTGAASVSGTIGLNLWIVPGANATGGTNNLIVAAGGGLSAASYVLSGGGLVYNAYNYTVGGLVLSDTAIGLALANQTPWTSVFWKGGFSGGSNVWALSDGTGNSNWTSDSAGAPTSLVPGPGATANFSAAGATNQGAMVLGANMSIGGIAVSDSTGVSLAADGHILALGTSGITVNAGAGPVSLAPPITLGAAQTWTNNSTNPMTVSGTVINGGNLLTVAGSGSTTVGGAIGGSGGLTQSGPGMVTLTASNGYTGTTTVNGGTLSVGNGGSGASINASSSVALSNGANITFNHSDQVTLNTSISGNGSLAKAGLGTLTISATQGYGGATIISGGMVKLAGGGIAAGLDIRAWQHQEGTIDGSLFNMPGSPTNSTFGSTPTIGYATQSINMNGSGPREHFGTGTNSGVPDSSTLRPTGYATSYTVEYRGKLNIPATGTYRFATTSDDGSALWIDQGDVAAANPNYSAAAVQNNAYQGMTQRSSQQLTLSTGYHDFIVRFYQGSGGNGLDVQWDPTGGSSFVPIPGIDFFHGSLVTVANILPATTDLSVAANSTLDLNGSSQQVASLANFNGSGGTMTNGGTSDAILTISGGGSTVFSGVITDGPTNKTALAISACTLELSGANTYSGSTSITAGTLRGGAAFALSASSDVSITGGMLDTRAFAQTVNSLTMGSGGALNLYIGHLLTATNHSSLNGTLTLSGIANGRVELMSFPNGYSGTFANPSGYTLDYLTNEIDVIGGASHWKLAQSGSWSTPSNWVGSVPGGNGAQAAIDPATGGSDYQITLDGAKTVGTLEFGNSNSATSGYTLTGTDTLTLNNNGTATITVTDGKHAIETPVALTGGLDVGGSGTLTFSGSISGTGPLTMSGTGGTLILSGTGLYTGGTIVSAGLLAVTSGTALPDNQSLTVGAGGTLIFDPSYVAAPIVFGQSLAVSPVPEPSTLALLAAGLVVGFGVWRRGKRIAN